MRRSQLAACRQQCHPIPGSHIVRPSRAAVRYACADAILRDGIGSASVQSNIEQQFDNNANSSDAAPTSGNTKNT